MIHLKSVIAVEGTVGAGKTTLINVLKDELGYEAYYELSDPMIENFLPSYYENKARWAFTLQVLFLITRYEQIKKAQSQGNVILDRSIFGDIIFASMLYKSGMMNDHEFMVYKRIYNSLISSIKPPTLMIYIKVPTDLAIERIRVRNRSYELITDYSYWHKLNAEYERYFANFDASCLLIVNGSNYDWVKFPSHGEAISEKVKEILKEAPKRRKKKNCRFEI